jgi:hypothetical protein
MGLAKSLKAVNENMDGARSETQRTLMNHVFVRKSDQFRDSQTTFLHTLVNNEQSTDDRP